MIQNNDLLSDACSKKDFGAMSLGPILIIEDDSALQEALMEHLEEIGDFNSVGAGSLAEATRLLYSDTNRFALIILDINLPDGDGFDFCSQLRRDGHRIPIIMLTGSATDADVARGLDVGANDYLVKPFRATELIARLNRALPCSATGGPQSSRSFVYV